MFLTKPRMATGAVFAASPALALTACGASRSSSSAASSSAPSPASSSTGSTASPASPASPGTGGTAADAVHTVSNTKLGTIVVNGKGLTLYRLDMDKQNASMSACTGQCAAVWPAAPAGDVSSVTGINHKLLGSITGTDGKPQLTLDSWPLYTFTQDSAAGDTNGQGFQGIWWAVTPAGAKAAASSDTTSSTSPSSGSASSGGANGY